MKVTVEGTEYDFEFDSLTLNEGITIQQRTSMLVPDWKGALPAGDFLAWKALCALLIERAKKEPINFEAFDCVYEEVTVVLPSKAGGASDPSRPRAPRKRPSSTA